MQAPEQEGLTLSSSLYAGCAGNVHKQRAQTACIGSVHRQRAQAACTDSMLASPEVAETQYAIDSAPLPVFVAATASELVLPHSDFHRSCLGSVWLDKAGHEAAGKTLSYLFRFRRLWLAVFTAGICACELMKNCSRSTLNDKTMSRYNAPHNAYR